LSFVVKNMTRWLDPHPVNTSPLDSLNLHPLVAQTLIRRGISSPAEARAFLNPDALPSTPFPGIEKATEHINLAIRKGHPVCVWGDFDVDGQTATTLLVQTLQALGAKVVYYIPIRGKESHGVHIESLKPIIDNGAKLILTCDTGITAHEAIDYANLRGVDVVVTDHHDLGERLPDAKAILNPKLLPADHPLANLAGVGVAYKLAEALLDGGPLTMDHPSPSVVHGLGSDGLLDLVALGLIADVALLKGETRSLAQKGIQALRTTQRLGLKLIAELSETNLATLTEETIGFTFAPRLNALGRLSDANPAVELLLTQDPARARVLAAQIEGLNTQRRLLTDQVHQAAEAQLRADPSLLTRPVILLSHPSWPGGVIGIVANRLVERYHKPALLFSESEDGILRGSARSIEGLHITQAIAACKDYLLGFGGHPMAAGLSLPAGKLNDFRKALNKAVERTLGGIAREEPTLEVDSWLDLPSISLELADSLEQLAPFGAGNPLLVLATRGLTLKSAKEMGKAKEHRKLVVTDEGGATQEVLWWNGAGEELPDGKFDLAFSLRANTFRGERRIALEFEDFRVIEEKLVEIEAPRLEIVDLRLQPGKLKEVNAEIFAEGEDKKKVGGVDRYGLTPSRELAVYTTPPGPVELRALMEKVRPQKVYLVGTSPSAEKTDGFLTRLAGMAKFAVNQRDGKVKVSDLAAATAQREATVRLGLEWLAAGGHLAIEGDEDELRLSTGDGIANQYLQRELYVAVKGLLDETAAYRAHFTRAGVNSLFNF
jgi:single-stranded-DNA-specific exonuclease